MPTTTWIQETAEDRYWEARGRHMVLGPPPPPVYPCVVCGRKFKAANERGWHASEAHPLARPTLYLGDQAAPSEVILRKRLGATGISLGSCTSLRVHRDGDLVDGIEPEELGAFVGGLHSAHLVLELENLRAVDNADVRSIYVFRVVIPDSEELEEVDRAFVTHLAVDRPSAREVEVFATAVARFVSTREYSGALADYVYGVLVKEGRESGGATLPLDAFPAKFNRALAELSDHVDRPVAAAVVGAARLNLNDLVTPIVVTGDHRLDGCATTLHQAAALLSPSDPAGLERGVAVVPLCPIDRDTHFILSAYETFVLRDSPVGRLAELETRLDDGSLSGSDRSKLRVLIATALLRDNDPRGARRHLEALVHDEIFRAWAVRELEDAA